MPCQVPRASARSATGIDSCTAVSAERTCAGMSSEPSSRWRKIGSPSATRRAKKRSRSARTSGAAFSWISRLAEVWRMKSVTRPLVAPSSADPLGDRPGDLEQAAAERVDGDRGGRLAQHRPRIGASARDRLGPDLPRSSPRPTCQPRSPGGRPQPATGLPFAGRTDRRRREAHPACRWTGRSSPRPGRARPPARQRARRQAAGRQAHEHPAATGLVDVPGAAPRQLPADARPLSRRGRRRAGAVHRLQGRGRQRATCRRSTARARASRVASSRP